MEPETDSITGKEWFEDDSFWEIFSPVLFPGEQFEQAESDVGKILSLIGNPVHTILDLCCGPGRFAGPLSRLGYRVTGVDLTAYLLNLARARFSEIDYPVEWIQEDMRIFLRPCSYDLILNLYTSFGYFSDPKDNLRVLKNIFSSLKPGGSFLIETMGKEILARIYNPLSVSKTGDMLLVQSHELKRNWTRIYNEWTLIRDAKVHTFAFEHNLYSAAELSYLFEEAGFSELKVYGNFEGDPYDHQAQRLVICGKKVEK